MTVDRAAGAPDIMPSTAELAADGGDSLASLERLKKVETEADEGLRALRSKIELTLAQLRDENETSVQAARTEAEQEAAALLDRARREADAEAARVLADAQGALAERNTGATSAPLQSWPQILTVLFGEFR